MIDEQILVGTTSKRIEVFLQDSSSTTGAGLTGLVFNSTNLACYYSREDDGDAGGTQIALATMTRGTWATRGFVEKDATNMPGVYQFGIPNAVLASGAKWAKIYFQDTGSALNLVPKVIHIQLTAYDPYDSVRLGLTALPNATAGATNGLPLSVDSSGRVDVLKINGTSQTARDIGASVLLSSGAGTGQLDFTSGVVKANATQILGSAVSTPATAGILDVNVKNIVNAAAAIDSNNLLKVDVEDWKGGIVPAVSVTGVPKVDIQDIAGAAVNTASAQLGVNVVNVGGTAQTGRDLGASVLLSSGTGTGQLDFTSGVVKANLAQILGTALTETAGQIAAAFKKFFNVASPVLDCTDVNQTGDSYARIGAAGAGLTALGDSRIAHLDADISSRTKPADTQAAVTTVTNLTNAPTAGDFTSTMKTSLNAATPAVTVSDKTGFSLSAAGVQAIWDALTSALTTVGSIGKLLVTNIDAAISSRLATSGYTTPPTVVQNRQEMDANSTKLANLDATISSRLAGASYTAPDNSDIAAIKAKTDNLPASPAATSDIPTANQNADSLLKRDWTAVSGEADRSTLNALRALRNKVSISGSTLTITKEDDTTEAWHGSLTTNPSQQPISAIDPA